MSAYAATRKCPISLHQCSDGACHFAYGKSDPEASQKHPWKKKMLRTTNEFVLCLHASGIKYGNRSEEVVMVARLQISGVRAEVIIETGPSFNLRLGSGEVLRIFNNPSFQLGPIKNLSTYKLGTSASKLDQGSSGFM